MHTVQLTTAELDALTLATSNTITAYRYNLEALRLYRDGPEKTAHCENLTQELKTLESVFSVLREAAYN